MHQTGDSEVDDRHTTFLWTPVTRGGKSSVSACDTSTSSKSWKYVAWL